MKPQRSPLEHVLIEALAAAIVKELRTNERPEGLNHPPGRDVRGQDERDAGYHHRPVAS